MLVRNAAVVLSLDLRCSGSEQVDVHRTIRSVPLRWTDVSTDVTCDV